MSIRIHQIINGARIDKITISAPNTKILFVIISFSIVKAIAVSAQEEYPLYVRKSEEWAGMDYLMTCRDEQNRPMFKIYRDLIDSPGVINIMFPDNSYFLGSYRLTDDGKKRFDFMRNADTGKFKLAIILDENGNGEFFDFENGDKVESFMCVKCEK